MRWLALLTVLVLAGCAGDDDERLTVYAASSLTEAFQELAPQHRYNFAGSDELAAQIREGAKADIFAAASPKYPGELHAQGLVRQPLLFASNRLVLIVPRRNGRDIRGVRGLIAPGVKLVIGADGVPVGDLTRVVLERLELTQVLDNVVSEEENVKGVVAKVALGEADAGFVYLTDARAASADVRMIELPATAPADVGYPIALVSETDQEVEAQTFVDLVLSPAGQLVLRRAGFAVP